ncbi:MAG: hybrid sensor histidine kinase/response regulator [Pegethrix bostrychoides GSE-TBD4-15B]|jgi:chemosensory pili system protein ChpA (sensor histidine kinase/response regulator)|uniref:histidine kinase n=1 Tax=Pegethrix bostrychoides GSE-TBD4-15B TaxID=2839662 RepID=A0A951PES3_9CYAN|nr:hybrid sensor histidine kinase/response regulator [Pegethrix bostrychoides GSE-TBD4-15B]
MSNQTQNQELEIQLQFLDEAAEYLGTLESAILGLSQTSVELEKVNAALRSAHSIKGGAAMMGYSTLSELAHRLEDSFKVLKVQRSVQVDGQIEQLLLAAVGCLRQVIDWYRQRQAVAPDWLAGYAHPIFEQLHQQLGDPAPEDAQSILSPEEGQEVVVLLFQTEVEGCLERLESVLAASDPRLREEVEILTQELGGLGEMLQLPAFTQLCGSIAQALAASAPTQIPEIAQQALQAWRESQALILTGQLDDLPNQIAQITRIAQIAQIAQIAEPEFADQTTQGIEVEPIAIPFRLSQPIPQSSPQSSPQPARSPEPQVAAEENPVENLTDSTVRVSVKQLNQLSDLFSELIIERNGLDLHLKRLRGLVTGLTERVKLLESSNMDLRDAYDKVETQALGTGASFGNSLSAPPETSSLASFDLLELDRYSGLHLLSQEVMETIVQVQEVTSDIDLGLDDAEQTTRELHKTSRQLQTRLTQVRMRPFADITNRFPRALRELSLQYQKPVQLKVEGEQLSIDRSILEALNEPLMHLLRNAFDHGIEPPELRQQQGKPAEGRIQIRASHQQNRTVITLSDDGAGIPIEKIRRRARQMGLDELLLDAATDHELLSLIFEPGFSTSEQVTALSGRGVGMDVVRSRLRQIQGEVTVTTQAGVGTTFTLSVPFTLSVARVLVAECRGMLLAFPTDAIVEIMVVPPEQVLSTAGNRAFSWNGHMVQLLQLSQWLKFHRPYPVDRLDSQAAISVPTVLLINQANLDQASGQTNQWLGLQVDCCWGEQEVALRQVEGGLPLPSGFSSCAILGDGRVVPLVNFTDLLRWIASCEHSQIESLSVAALPAQPAALSSQQDRQPPNRQPTVLIVDDSINVRRFLALTLERAGYQVAQAKDGQDALDRLLAGLAVQAVICDIEMPRLDGYEFLTRVKATPQFKTIPVAMLTSRSGDKHRHLAMRLGASAYFSKPYNEQVLLQTLESLMTLTPA